MRRFKNLGSLKSFLWYALQLLWVSPSSLSSLHDRAVNQRWTVEARNRTLFAELANWEDGRLMCQNNHIPGVWMPGSFIGQRFGEVRKQKGHQSCKYLLEWPASVRKWVNFFPPVAIHRWTGSWTKALWFNIQAEGQSSPKQAVMDKQLPFSKQKQAKAMFNVKETDLTWSQNWLFPATLWAGQMGGRELQLDLGVS